MANRQIEIIQLGCPDFIPLILLASHSLAHLNYRMLISQRFPAATKVVCLQRSVLIHNNLQSAMHNHRVLCRGVHDAFESPPPVLAWLYPSHSRLTV